MEHWASLAAGLKFERVTKWASAMIRISFDATDGSWSYVGTDCLNIPKSEPTMNFGWPLDTPWGKETALHEWGHALGYHHEHQNPFAGIVWDEDAVIEAHAGDPNFWDEETTRQNILNKLSPDEVQGSAWDPDSIMHYPFRAGLIVRPEKFRGGIQPAPGLSPLDISRTREFYPGIDVFPTRLMTRGTSFHLTPYELKLTNEFRFVTPMQAGECFHIFTEGSADTVLVIQDEAGQQIAADDDSGLDKNAAFKTWSRRAMDLHVLLRVVWVAPDSDVKIVRPL